MLFFCVDFLHKSSWFMSTFPSFFRRWFTKCRVANDEILRKSNSESNLYFGWITSHTYSKEILISLKIQILGQNLYFFSIAFIILAELVQREPFDLISRFRYGCFWLSLKMKRQGEYNEKGGSPKCHTTQIIKCYLSMLSWTLKGD